MPAPGGVRLLHTGDLFGRPGRQVAAVLSAFRAEIDDPVRVTNYVKVVFNDDDRVAEICETVQDFEKLFTSSKCSPVVGSSRR